VIARVILKIVDLAWRRARVAFFSVVALASISPGIGHATDLPDLTISPLTIGTIVENENGTSVIPVTYTVTNTGTIQAQSSWNDAGFLSASGILDNNAQASYLNTRSTALAPGASYTATVYFTANGSTAPGTYTLFVKADGHIGNRTDGGDLAELDETNNVSSATVTLTRPDLTISPLTIGTIVENENGTSVIPVTYTVTNVGTIPAQSSWNDAGFLSASGVLDNNAQGNYLNTRSTPLAPGASYTVTVNFMANASTPPGTYTLFMKADGRISIGNRADGGDLAEADETNNVSSATVTLTRPDLTISPLTIGTVVENQNGTSVIPVTYTVTNVGTIPAQSSWNDAGFLSASGVLDNNAQGNYLNTRSTPLAPGASYTVTVNFTANASTPPGTYTLFMKADGRISIGNRTDGGDLTELDETNNVSSATVTLSRPDLTISPLTIGTIVENENGTSLIPVTYTVANIGTIPAQSSWSDTAFLSASGVLDNNAQAANLNTRSTPLAPGASYTATVYFTASASTAPGTYTLFMKADGHIGAGFRTDAGDLAEVDETNNVSSASALVKAKTVVALGASANSVSVGNSVVLTATLTPISATGSVTFKDGATELGSAALVSGVATFSTSFTTAGTHSLTAIYGGDTYNYAGSSSAIAVTATMGATTTSLAANPNPAVAGQSTTFTSTVTGVIPGGSVTFKDGAISLGAAPVASGTATLATTFSTTGEHSVIAYYGGDANNQASQSAALLFNVTAVPVVSGATSWTYSYTTGGSLRAVVDPNGHQTDFGFDNLQRTTTVMQPTLASGTRPVISTAFDGQDRATQVTDPRTLATSYTLDGLGNRKAISSPDTGAGTSAYDAQGNLTSSTDARGKTTNYAYDSLNRLTTVTYASGTPTTFEYDGGSTGAPNAVGHLTRMTDESGSTSYTYDGFGHLMTKTQVIGSGANAKTFTVAYTWGTSGDTNGKLLAITYPSGSQLNYGYDGGGRMASLSVNPVNANGVGTNTGTSLSLLTGIAYDGADRVLGWTWSDGTAYQRSYDSYGRLVTYPLGNPVGTGAAAGLMRTLTYDGNRGIKGYTHTQGGTAQAQFDQTFSYDTLDRLVDSTVAGVHYGYSYDLNGNRTTRIIGSTSYANGVATTSNRLLQVQSPGPSGPVTNTYQYDNAGNTTNDGSAAYVYSDRGRMSSATVTGGTVNYLYDGRQQRASKTGPAALVPTGSAYYIHDEEGHLLGEYDANGTPVHEALYLGNTPVGVIKQTGSATAASLQVNLADVYSDQVDAPRVIARSLDQAVVWRWDSAEAFGASPPNENPAGLGVFRFDQRFPGQVADVESSSFYNWNRDYNPSLGRYVQSDPLGLSGGGMSTYAYAAANPLMNVDPNGKQVAQVIVGIPVLIVGCALTPACRDAVKNAMQSKPSDSSPTTCKPAIPDVEPGDDCEYYALAAAKSGAGVPIMDNLADAPRLEAFYGAGPWIKMQYTQECHGGKKLVIHYFHSQSSGRNEELKFVPYGSGTWSQPKG
jgi:RHS repeat-associated protein